VSVRLPSLAADEVIRVLKKAGFEVTRIKGFRLRATTTPTIFEHWCNQVVNLAVEPQPSNIEG
jgi:hypothetical protein